MGRPQETAEYQESLLAEISAWKSHNKSLESTELDEGQKSYLESLASIALKNAFNLVIERSRTVGDKALQEVETMLSEEEVSVFKESLLKRMLDGNKLGDW